ncbi:MAG: hypothetical protein WCW27_01245 [Patescibacteria group bacterium]|jgi:hypothetical protein
MQETEPYDRKHRQRITDKTIKPILKRLRGYQNNFISLNAIALVMKRSLRTIQHHTRRGYLFPHCASFTMRQRYVVELPDFIRYIKTYWRIDTNGNYVFKRRRVKP